MKEIQAFYKETLHKVRIILKKETLFSNNLFKYFAHSMTFLATLWPLHDIEHSTKSIRQESCFNRLRRVAAKTILTTQKW